VFVTNSPRLGPDGSRRGDAHGDDGGDDHDHDRGRGHGDGDDGHGLLEDQNNVVL